MFFYQTSQEIGKPLFYINYFENQTKSNLWSKDISINIKNYEVLLSMFLEALCQFPVPFTYDWILSDSLAQIPSQMNPMTMEILPGPLETCSPASCTSQQSAQQ